VASGWLANGDVVWDLDRNRCKIVTCKLDRKQRQCRRLRRVGRLLQKDRDPGQLRGKRESARKYGLPDEGRRNKHCGDLAGSDQDVTWRSVAHVPDRGALHSGHLKSRSQQHGGAPTPGPEPKARPPTRPIGVRQSHNRHHRQFPWRERVRPVVEGGSQQCSGSAPLTLSVIRTWREYCQWRNFLRLGIKSPSFHEIHLRQPELPLLNRMLLAQARSVKEISALFHCFDGVRCTRSVLGACGPGKLRKP